PDFFFFQAEDGIRDGHVTGVQTCALPIWLDRQLRAGGWHASDPLRNEETMGRELGAMTVGIIGMGNIGSAVAHRVAAFGARILRSEERRVGKECSSRMDP